MLGNEIMCFKQMVEVNNPYLLPVEWEPEWMRREAQRGFIWQPPCTTFVMYLMQRSWGKAVITQCYWKGTEVTELSLGTVWRKKKKEPSRKKSSPNFPSILWLQGEPGCESVVSAADLRSGPRCTLVLYSQQPSFSGDLRAPVLFFLRKLRVDRPGDNGRGLDTFSSHSKDSVLYFE